MVCCPTDRDAIKITVIAAEIKMHSMTRDAY